MKKTLLLITAAALVCGGNAMAEEQPQIPNGDFETWNYDGENLPDNWNSFQTASGGKLNFIIYTVDLAEKAYDSDNRQVKRSTDTRPGSTGQYSCSIWSRTVLGNIVAQGNLTTGRVYAGAMSAADKANYNYTDRKGAKSGNGKVGEPCAMKFTGKPKAVKVWVKYVQGGGDYGDHATAKFSAVIHSDADYISYGLPSYDTDNNKALVVASVAKEIEYNGGNWEELTLPFEYTNNGATPAYIQINASTNAYPGAGNVGDYLFIDDIEMVYESAADNVIALINAIGTVEYTDASKAKIDAARAAYDALTDAQKALVSADVVKVLTDAETTYAQLKQAAEEAAAQAAADKAAADAAIASINAIGTVEYTDASKAKIDAARTAYNNLTDAQKALVTDADVKVLTDAETTYAQLKQQAEKEKQDKAAADAAVDKINAIGTVEYSDASKQKIDAARAAYDALTDAQKALVTDADVKVLTDAEAKYAELKQAADEAAAQAAADKAAADAAIAKINAIGTVEYTEASKAKIDAARAAYDGLTDAQKALVTDADVKVLTDAEAKYAELKQAAEEAAAQAEADKKAADAAIASINTIGTVAYTGESKQKIDAARTAYNALTDAQKALVSADVVKVLTDAEAAYAELEQAADQAAKDKTAADAAIAKINAIGNVEYSDASKQKIDAARTAYDALTADQKALVNNETVAVLTAAETRYAELKQAAEEAAAQAAKDKAAADAAIAKINAIGTVEYSDASKAKIDAAREAYDALTDAQKTLVTASDLAKLTAAEDTYAQLKKQAEEAAQQAEQAAKELAEAKTALSEGISEAKKYYESIKADYAGVAATLQAAINAAAEVLNSATVTKAQADDAKAALAAAVKKAQDDVTVITGISTAKSEAGTADVWYDMNGRRLPGKPTTKGLYIRNGKKVAM